MDFQRFISGRQSDRAFDMTRTVEKEKIDRILEAVRLAPSANNSQPWHIIVVDDPELKNKVADATSSKMLGINHFTKQAPIHLILIEEKANLSSSIGGWIKKRDYSQTDLGIAAAHIVLAAYAEGLGSCMIGWFNEKKIQRLLSIPSSKRICLDIVIGYSTQPTRHKKRKDKDEISSFNKY